MPDATAVWDLLVARLSDPLLAKSSTPALLAACSPHFAALLLPLAIMGALLPLSDAPELVKPEVATALQLLCLTATAVVGAAVADALDLVVTPEHAAPGLAVLGWWTAASLACLADLTALTLLAAAAALALALVVIPDGCVAALAVVAVRDVTAGPEGFVGTAGLLGAAMDHAGRLAGQVIKGPGHERVWGVRDEAPCRE